MVPPEIIAGTTEKRFARASSKAAQLAAIDIAATIEYATRLLPVIYARPTIRESPKTTAKIVPIRNTLSYKPKRLITNFFTGGGT